MLTRPGAASAHASSSRPALSLIATGLLLTGCSAASAAPVDPGRDLDCSVVAFYFAGWAKHVGAPADQQRAGLAVRRWYNQKLEAAGVDLRGESHLRKVAPVLAAIKADPQAMGDEMMTCTNRAIADPAWKAFARTLPG